MTKFNDLLTELLSWFNTYQSGVLWSVFLLLVYFLVTRKIFPLIDRNVEKSGFKDSTLRKAYHVVRLLSGTVTLVALLIVWGVDISGLLLLSTSLLTLTGVALFANWSLLSNITAYFVLLFHTAYKRGNFIRILEIEEVVEGYIADIGIFNVKLITEDREQILYPNNLFLARPTIINPKNRLNTNKEE
ncbi:mechanosensitive ion channel family protein [Marinomonas agarivorans]|nr:mechanosensitive ion channel family protein [Marinomonas agarivorans]